MLIRRNRPFLSLRYPIAVAFEDKVGNLDIEQATFLMIRISGTCMF
jgi:hypothetical protein